MSRIETGHVNDAFYSPKLRSDLAAHAEPYAATASTGGTAIDSSGNIYVSDTDRRAIQKVSPDGTVHTLIQDVRLSWVDAMWIDMYGRLWMPAAQLNKGIPFNNGKIGRAHV